jgi:hypothetical protein
MCLPTSYRSSFERLGASLGLWGNEDSQMFRAFRHTCHRHLASTLAHCLPREISSSHSSMSFESPTVEIAWIHLSYLSELSHWLRQRIHHTDEQLQDATV